MKLVVHEFFKNTYIIDCDEACKNILKLSYPFLWIYRI